MDGGPVAMCLAACLLGDDAVALRAGRAPEVAGGVGCVNVVGVGGVVVGGAARRFGVRTASSTLVLSSASNSALSL